MRVQAHLFISELTGLLLRCQNTAVLHLTEWERIREFPTRLLAEAILKRTSALTELNRMGEVAHILNRVAFEMNLGNSDAERYLKARCEFFLNHYDTARDLCIELAATAVEPRYKYSAHLGLANYASEKKDIALAKASLGAARQFKDQIATEDWLNLLVVEARVARKLELEFRKADSLYREALTIASTHAWTYFINHSLFGLALVANAEGNLTEAAIYVNLLRCTTNKIESPLLLHQINDLEFKESNLAIGLPIDFNEDRLEIKVGPKLISLSSKALLFHFLLLLSRSPNVFLSKEDIAKNLWKDEAYHPLVHDARIFDLVKRARLLIEEFDERPVHLLSGRMGYKLIRET